MTRREASDSVSPRAASCLSSMRVPVFLMVLVCVIPARMPRLSRLADAVPTPTPISSACTPFLKSDTPVAETSFSGWLLVHWRCVDDSANLCESSRSAAPAAATCWPSTVLGGSVRADSSAAPISRSRPGPAALSTW